MCPVWTLEWNNNSFSSLSVKQTHNNILNVGDFHAVGSKEGLHSSVKNEYIHDEIYF